MAKKEQKGKTINSLEGVFAKAAIGVVTDYRGITANELTKLRRQLRGAGMEYHVVKNTLARIAARQAGREEVTPLLEGPVAVVIGYKDEASVARTIADYIVTNKSTMSIKGGFLPGRRLSAKDVATVATLPPREVLLSILLGEVQKPIAMLISYLNAPIAGLAGVLQGRIQQLEGK